MRELAARVGNTAFVGYDHLNSEGIVQALLKGDQLVKEAREGDEIEVVLDVTSFYAEGGGQAGDQGILTGTDGSVEIRETTRPVPTLIVHKGVVRSGSIREGERLQLSVNRRTRQDAARNHTATHLVHAALRDLLGPHVKQYGSLVAPNRLRFDFAHFRPLASRDIDEIESIVNEQVRYDQTVQTDVMGVQEAVAAGALAFFGDKYGDQVRVVHIDTFSKELCGGTHCRRTGEIGLFRIVSESGVAAGVRRIECLTGSGASDSVKRLEGDVRELSDLLKVAPAEIVSRTRKLTEQLKEKERELAEVKLKMASTSSSDAQVRAINGIQVHAQRTDGLDVNGMRALADQLRDKLRSGVVALGAANDGKVSLLVVVTKDLVGRLKAGELIKEMATDVGGTGGGRPEMAQAGGKIPKALAPRWKKFLGWSRRPWRGKLMKGQRILAIDHGSKRIGFASSDELGWTAQPLETFHRRNPDADIRHIQDLVREHEVGQVLVRMPFRLDGENWAAAKVVEAFHSAAGARPAGPGDHLGRTHDDLRGRGLTDRRRCRPTQTEGHCRPHRGGDSVAELFGQFGKAALSIGRRTERIETSDPWCFE